MDEMLGDLKKSRMGMSRAGVALVLVSWVVLGSDEQDPKPRAAANRSRPHLNRLYIGRKKEGQKSAGSKDWQAIECQRQRSRINGTFSIPGQQLGKEMKQSGPNS